MFEVIEKKCCNRIVCPSESTGKFIFPIVKCPAQYILWSQFLKKKKKFADMSL